MIVVTYNSADCLGALIDSLRAETTDLTLRVVVADNSSSDGTLEFARSQHPDVLAFATGGNLGYSGGINAAMRRAGDAATVVVLNPDLTVERGSLASMMQRLQASQAGAVVPRLLNSSGPNKFFTLPGTHHSHCRWGCIAGAAGAQPARLAGRHRLQPRELRTPPHRGLGDGRRPDGPASPGGLRVVG